MTSLLVRGASSVVSFRGTGPIRGEAFDDILVLENASILCADGRIASVGEEAEAEAAFDASDCVVVPGFVDCHSHIPFFGWRADEDAARLSGKRYEELHLGEGGIYRSARMLAEAADEEVIAFSEALANSMLQHGTTTFEMKSGYGLSVEAELRQLRLARTFSDRIPQRTVTTCLAAHAIPRGKSAGAWIGEAAEELLPRAVDEELVTACDLYVESIAFGLEHAARLLETAKGLGLRMRMHADQLSNGTGGEYAARRGFATADHLNHTEGDGIDALASSDTVAVLLPGATFTLRQTTKPPARDLIDAGAIVAVGTDLNPGTSPIASMPFVIALACRLYGLRPLEALAAATVNAAYALGLGDEVGRISPGYRADLAVLEVSSFDEIAYRPDRNPVIATICGGEMTWLAPQARSRLA